MQPRSTLLYVYFSRGFELCVVDAMTIPHRRLAAPWLSASFRREHTHLQNTGRLVTSQQRRACDYKTITQTPRQLAGATPSAAACASGDSLTVTWRVLERQHAD